MNRKGTFSEGEGAPRASAHMDHDHTEAGKNFGEIIGCRGGSNVVTFMRIVFLSVPVVAPTCVPSL